MSKKGYSSTDLSVDGQGIVGTVTQKSQSTIISEPIIMFEVNELKRNLERMEADLKRKERTIQALQAELVIAKKDFRNSQSEVQSTRERNQQLQNSLSNARETISSQRVALDDVGDINVHRAKIVDLEELLSVAVRKNDDFEEKLTTMRNSAMKTMNREVTDLINQLQHDLKVSKKSEDDLKNELLNLQLRLEKLESRSIEDVKQLESIRKLYESTKKQLMISENVIIQKDDLISTRMNEIS